MMSLPGGTVTFLFTDIESSTRLWRHVPQAMQAALDRHDTLCRETVTAYRGTAVKHTGDGYLCVFAQATDAVRAAHALQAAYQSEPWAQECVLCVRMALHTGEAQLRDGDYFGTTVNRCARLLAIAHGEQVLLSQAVYELLQDTAPAACSLTCLGSHRLKDLDRPEIVYQLCHAALRADFPPLRSLNAFPNNLPQQVTSFIGREQEIGDVKALLRQSRLLLLKGVGGCGKTRLALQVAAEMVEEFAEGVWLVELAPLMEPGQIVQAVAATLGVKESGSGSLKQAVVEWLRTETRLLVLDNCEHLLEACAELAAPILRECPHVRLLATSRETLKLTGETVWEVPPLGLPPASETVLARLAQAESVRLFVERARLVKPRFALTPENAPAVTQICRQLDGLPFALELAAAQVVMFTPQEIARDLYPLLEEDAGVLDAPDRHRTLLKLMDWSYLGLAAAEQMLLARLSVFAGGWTLRAAQRVCGDEEDTGQAAQSPNRLGRSALVVRLLTRLARASLIVVEEQDAETRYRLLEPVREYAKQNLSESGQADAILDRHVAYFLEMAEEAEPHLMGAAQQEWLARLEADHDNLRAALTQAVDAETRLRLAGALWRFWEMRSNFTEGRARLQQALSRAGTGLPLARAKVLRGLGILTLRQSEPDAAKSLLEESLVLYEAAGNALGMAHALNNLGQIASNQNAFEEAQSLYERSTELYRESENLWGLAACLNNRARLAHQQNDLTKAQISYEESLALYQRLGDKAREAIVSVNLAGIHFDRKEYFIARSLYEQGLEQLRQAGNQYAISIILYNFAASHYFLNEIETAEAFLIECVLLRHSLKNYSNIHDSLMLLACIAADKQEYERSAVLFLAAERLRKDYNSEQAWEYVSLMNQKQADAVSHISQEAYGHLAEKSAQQDMNATIFFASRQE